MTRNVEHRGVSNHAVEKRFNLIGEADFGSADRLRRSWRCWYDEDVNTGEDHFQRLAEGYLSLSCIDVTHCGETLTHLQESSRIFSELSELLRDPLSVSIGGLDLRKDKGISYCFGHRWELDALQSTPQLHKRMQRGLIGVRDRFLDFLVEIVIRHADAQTSQAQWSARVGRRRLAICHCLEKQTEIFRPSGHRTNVIEGPSNWRHAFGRQSAEGSFQAEYSTRRRWDPDRASGIGAYRTGDNSKSDGHCRPAT